MYNLIQVYLPTTEKLINQSDYASTTLRSDLKRAQKRGYRDSAIFVVTATENSQSQSAT